MVFIHFVFMKQQQVNSLLNQTGCSYLTGCRHDPASALQMCKRRSLVGTLRFSDKITAPCQSQQTLTAGLSSHHHGSHRQV